MNGPVGFAGASDGNFNWPAALNAVQYRERWNFKFLRPLSDRLLFAERRQNDGGGSIIGLLLRRRPAAVAWFVVAVVVDTVQLMSRRRARPHVSEERRETVTPPVAHCDTATAVAVELCVSGPVAPLLNPRPNIELWRVGEPVLGHLLVARHGGIALGAAAGLGVSGRQCLANDVGDSSAIAHALPKKPSPLAADETNRRKASKALSGFINERWHVPNMGMQRLNYKR